MFEFLIDCIFPKFCTNCHTMGEFICRDCLSSIKPYSAPIMLDLDNYSLDSVTAMAEYDEVISSAVVAMKYQSIRDIGKLLGRIICANTSFPFPSVITAVPLHPARQQERGFNQAEVIAKEIARIIKRPYHQLLIRQKKTSSQVVAGTRQARLTQLQNAFALSPLAQQNLELLRNETVLIIDDVITTGATLNECAIVLKRAGFSRVDALAVAHGST